MLRLDLSESEREHIVTYMTELMYKDTGTQRHIECNMSDLSRYISSVEGRRHIEVSDMIELTRQCIYLSDDALWYKHWLTREVVIDKGSRDKYVFMEDNGECISVCVSRDCNHCCKDIKSRVNITLVWIQGHLNDTLLQFGSGCFDQMFQLKVHGNGNVGIVYSDSPSDFISSLFDKIIGSRISTTDMNSLLYIFKQYGESALSTLLGYRESGMDVDQIIKLVSKQGIGVLNELGKYKDIQVDKYREILKLFDKYGRNVIEKLDAYKDIDISKYQVILDLVDKYGYDNIREFVSLYNTYDSKTLSQFIQEYKGKDISNVIENIRKVNHPELAYLLAWYDKFNIVSLNNIPDNLVELFGTLIKDKRIANALQGGDRFPEKGGQFLADKDKNPISIESQWFNDNKIPKDKIVCESTGRGYNTSQKSTFIRFDREKIAWWTCEKDGYIVIVNTGDSTFGGRLKARCGEHVGAMLIWGSGGLGKWEIVSTTGDYKPIIKELCETFTNEKWYLSPREIQRTNKTILVPLLSEE